MNVANESELLLVGIASSAGGLQPLLEMVELAVCHHNMAFIIVPHLSRDYESKLPEILKKVSALHIKKIDDKEKIEPCHLYVLPPGQYATVKGNTLHLQPRPEFGMNHSADILFKSLSTNYGRNAIGVVLSGSAVGADGSHGVCEIKKAGGHTYAQDPLTAEFPQMPELAIDTGCIDSVLSPYAIGHELTLLSWAR